MTFLINKEVEEKKNSILRRDKMIKKGFKFRQPPQPSGPHGLCDLKKKKQKKERFPQQQ